MPSPTPTAAALIDSSSSRRPLLQRGHLLVREPLARLEGPGERGLPQTADDEQTRGEQEQPLAQAQPIDALHDFRDSLHHGAVACSRSRARARGAARRAERRFAGLVVALDLELVEPLPRERGLAAQALHVLRHELGREAAPLQLDRPGAAVDRELREPQLRRALARQRSQVTRETVASPERLLAQHVDEPLLVGERGVQTPELRFELRATIRAQGGIDARELRRQRLLAAFELHHLGLERADLRERHSRREPSSAAATTPERLHHRHGREDLPLLAEDRLIEVDLLVHGATTLPDPCAAPHRWRACTAAAPRATARRRSRTAS